MLAVLLLINAHVRSRSSIMAAPGAVTSFASRHIRSRSSIMAAPGAATSFAARRIANRVHMMANATENSHVVGGDPMPRLWGLKGKGERPDSDYRDSLPYTLVSVGPPEVQLGTFSLDPLTHCGDTLCVNDRKYKVTRVTFCYKLSSGKYVMARKMADCKEQTRVSAEEALRRMFDADSVPGIREDDKD